MQTGTATAPSTEAATAIIVTAPPVVAPKTTAATAIVTPTTEPTSAAVVAEATIVSSVTEAVTAIPILPVAVIVPAFRGDIVLVGGHGCGEARIPRSGGGLVHAGETTTVTVATSHPLPVVEATATIHFISVTVHAAAFRGDVIPVGSNGGGKAGIRGNEGSLVHAGGNPTIALGSFLNLPLLLGLELSGGGGETSLLHGRGGEVSGREPVGLLRLELGRRSSEARIDLWRGTLVLCAVGSSALLSLAQLVLLLVG
jgi:hypothetical protein